MASLARGRRIIKLLTPQEMSQAVAEWVLVRQGYQFKGHCSVRTDFIFKKGETEFSQAKCEIEAL